MNVETRGIRGQPRKQFGQFLRAKSGFRVVLRFVTAALKVLPIFRQLPQERLFLSRLRRGLGGFQFRLHLVYTCLHIGGADIFGINLPQRRMFFDQFVAQRLGDSGVVHFAVTVTPVPDQIDDHIIAKSVAIFQGNASDAHHGIDIFRVDVEDRDRLPPGKLCRKSR